MSKRVEGVNSQCWKKMEKGRGYDLVVTKKEEAGVYWGSSKGLLVKFNSNQELEIGQIYFVTHSSVIEKKMPPNQKSPSHLKSINPSLILQ